MEVLQPQKIKFYGEWSKFLGIYIINIFLTIITIGIYYPWAKAAIFKYLWGETEFDNERFVFHGTGREMFIGFIKAIALFGSLTLLVGIAEMTENVVAIAIATFIFSIGFILLVPLAIHGALKYRSSRTSWKGIHAGYRGDRQELMKKFVAGLLLTILTLGLYGAWFINDIRKYLIDHLRFGSLEFKFNGKGVDFFLINLIGIALSILTAGIYIFWYARNIYRFYVNNLEVHQKGSAINFESTATAGKIFKLIIPNILIILFTLGLGIPYAIIRYYRFIFDNANLQEYIDTNAIIQTEEDYRDATGEDLMDLMDIGF
ncbi:MAG: DUF898 family protein [Chitinophagales bacterium]|nr:DUF898 family protein [Chitinophagales bacterium]